MHPAPGPIRVSDCPADIAGTDPARIACIFGDRRMSYGELAAAIDACARALLARRIGKGDRIAILSTPRPEFLVVLLAGLRIGALVIGLNPVHQLAEYRAVLGDCAPKLIFGFRRLRGRDKLIDLLALKRAFGQPLIDLDGAEDGGFGTRYAEFLADGTRVTDRHYAAAVAAVQPNDVALIVHTSGSTGRPKGAMITHGNLAAAAGIQLHLFAPKPLVSVCNLPVNHTACTCDLIAYTLLGGGTLVFQEKFDPAALMQAIERHRVTFLLQVTAMYHRILEEAAARPSDTSSLQYVFFLGAPMPRALIADLRRLGGTIVTGWGLTECTASATYTSPGDVIDVLAESVGRAAPGFELRVADKEGVALPDGQIGEVLVRGPSVMAGYFGNEAATAEAFFTGGWLRSGDLGRIDAEGRLTLTGRIKEMFKSGGYNVYPREVELVLEAHQAIALAVVVAVPDDVYFETGCAFVMREPGVAVDAEDLRAFCAARLANYKIPKRFEIRDTLPMLAIGKIDKVALRAEAERLRAALL
jgi:acyl-CoA synthetase (AMP-forming)/AMP-acid ligase II